MFADPNDSSPLGPALIAAGSAVIVAIIAGVIALISNKKSNRNAEILARLNTELAHGQAVSSTQWAAEFSAYQAMWKSVVPVRGCVGKLTHRHDELSSIGVLKSDLDLKTSLTTRQELLGRTARLLAASMLAINENAPFYSHDIRQAANDAHRMATNIYLKHVAAVVSSMKNLSEDSDTQGEWDAFTRKVDDLEDMIRARMKAVRVVNPA